MRGERTFTTYLNVETGKGNERALSAFERQANDSLRRVQQTAEKAGAVASGVIPGAGSPARLQMLAAAERQRAQALQSVTRATRDAEAASNRRAGSLMLESNAARAAATNTSRLERALRLAAVSANVAQGPLGPIAGRLSAMATAVRELAGVQLGIVGIGAATAGFVRYASTTQDLIARLRPLYDTQVQVNAAFKDAQYIANSARVGLEPVIDLYARLTLAGREAGLSQQRISRITEIATKAAQLSGGTSVSKEAGLYQFAQGVGSGTLQGDELKSIRENTLRLAKAIADGMGVPLGELKKLGKEGKLTPKVIADALEKEAARIDAEMAKLPPTISSATTKLSNAFIDLVAKTENATGVTSAFANLITLLADNLTGLVHALGLVALAYAGFRSGRMITDTTARIEAWNQERRAMLNTANEAKRTAKTQIDASRDRIRALKDERAALQQQVVAEQQRANETRRAAMTSYQKFSSPDYIGRPQDFAAYNQALANARVAQDNLAASKNRLRNISGELRGSYGTLVTSTGAYGRATRAAAAASVTFANAARGLWAAINPVGLALAFAIPLLIEFAFRQDSAAGAADRMAESQNRLARFIDFTTGRVREQNKALIENEILQQKEAGQQALKDYASGRRSLATESRGILSLGQMGGAIRGTDPRVQSTVNDYLAGRINSSQASERLSGLKLSGPSATVRDRAVSRLAKITTSAQEAEQANSAQRVLSGKGTAEDRRRIQGNFSGEDVDLTGAGVSRAADGEKKLAGARRDRKGATDEAAKAERELQRVQDLTDKRNDILARYDEQSSAIDKARKDARELGQLVGKAMNGLVEISDKNPLGKGIYTAEMAAADAARISYGVRKPMRDAVEEQQRGLDIARLRLAGYDLEATALERALTIQDQIGELNRTDLETLIANERKQQDINDALASRERQVSQILELAQATRDSFEEMFVGLRKDPISAIKGFGNQLLDNVTRIRARQITEKLFEGADAKLRELVTGSNGVDRASEILAASVKRTADSMPPLAAANDNLATATENAAARINAAANSIGGTAVGGLAPSTSLDRATEGVNKALTAADGVVKATENLTGGKVGAVITTIAGAVTAAAGGSRTPDIGGSGASEGGGYVDENGEYQIVVQGARRPPSARSGGKDSNIPSGASAYNAVFERLGEKLDKTFKSGTFFKGIGKGVGTALQGAAEGQMASGVASALGIKQSKTGAAVGGAIGNLILPGIGGFIGGALGGTIGGLFKKTKSGSSTISIGADGAFAGAASGNSQAYRDTASGLSGGVADRLNQVAKALNATLTLGGSSISIGQRKDKFTVDTTGRNRTKGSGVLKFDSEEAAAQYAFQQMLQRVVLGGISQASQNIIRAGANNIEVAVEKALAIESIPKRLMARTDPVRYAVTELNEEFSRLISYLKEGGAAAEQFADAQKLYELERAEAIERATQQASTAIQAYIDELKGGSGSPFNKRTTYQNAADKLNSFRGDIMAGRAVNDNELLAAARNYQDASRELFGSGAGFFSAFDDIMALLTKARDNLTAGVPGGSTTPLPGSPFTSDSQVAAVLGQLNGTTQTQTDVLAARLDTLIDLVGSQGFSFSPSGSSLHYLPGNLAA